MLKNKLGMPFVSQWGEPQVDETPVLQPSDEFTPMRGAIPRWAPGEFEEWKTGKLTGQGTAFGRHRQMIHDAGPLADLMQQFQAQAPQRNLEQAQKMGFRGLWSPDKMAGLLGRNFAQGWENNISPVFQNLLKKFR